MLLKIVFIAAIAASVLSFERFDDQIKVVDDTSSFQDNNPGVRLTPFKKIVKGPGRFVFTFGKHEENDYDAYIKAKMKTFVGKVNAEAAVFYPPKNQVKGYKLTFIEVTVHQDSDDCEVYLVEGGPGAERATVLIQPKGVSRFEYKAKFYIPI